MSSSHPLSDRFDFEEQYRAEGHRVDPCQGLKTFFLFFVPSVKSGGLERRALWLGVETPTTPYAPRSDQGGSPGDERGK